jgi:peptidyl-dipeptidase Dcp
MAKRLHDTIMQVGYSVPPDVAYRNFRGRDPQVAAYLRAKGFPVTVGTETPTSAGTK